MSIDRKALILKAATQSFAQFGYKATTMDLVSKIASVGKGTIYTFFKTKEELFEAILNKAEIDLKEAMNCGFAKEGGQSSFIHSVFNLLDSILEFRSDHELFVKLAQEVRDIGTAQALEGIRRMERFGLDFLKQKLDLAIEKGEVRDCDTTIISYMIFRLYLSLATEWNKSHSEPLTKEQIKENIAMLITQGIVKEARS
ncbi:TetR/AcrR family transcriptional regulator [Paenibacillus glycanilyticus]|uniref:TetR/AcrR family transcriptional regulator n=1 Tax=Paenibacillus glycanilyticus TaxID=126569 RepID=UPI00203BDC80|nr:TetR/AcrR family transcriptional regulator [Paenibacillus glycanilyticus]MCM3628742.1 TetR/AcrR family transcriptional regulator [Paenibacillus glycanilyticus]